MFTNLLWAVHIINCVILIIVVLLQAGKGSTVGLSFGGGASQTVFGSSGGKNFFARLTSVLAVLFMVTSVLLSVVSSRRAQSYRGVMQNLPMDQTEPTQPVAPASAPAQQGNTPPQPQQIPAGR